MTDTSSDRDVYDLCGCVGCEEKSVAWVVATGSSFVRRFCAECRQLKCGISKCFRGITEGLTAETTTMSTEAVSKPEEKKCCCRGCTKDADIFKGEGRMWCSPCWRAHCDLNRGETCNASSKACRCTGCARQVVVIKNDGGYCSTCNYNQCTPTETRCDRKNTNWELASASQAFSSGFAAGTMTKPSSIPVGSRGSMYCYCLSCPRKAQTWVPKFGQQQGFCRMCYQAECHTKGWCQANSTTTTYHAKEDTYYPAMKWGEEVVPEAADAKKSHE